MPSVYEPLFLHSRQLDRGLIQRLNFLGGPRFLYICEELSTKQQPFGVSFLPLMSVKIAKCRHLLLRGGGGHFAGMPMVADGREVGVKNRKILPTS